MEAKSTARQILKNFLAQIASEGLFTVSDVCHEAKMDPSVVSRWKATSIEPRLSTLEKLQDAYEKLKAKQARRAGNRH